MRNKIILKVTQSNFFKNKPRAIQPNRPAKPNRVKKTQKGGWKGGGGATMCHNILLPSKVAKEWRNIPF